MRKGITLRKKTGVRKNAVNRSLLPIDGGVCAPEGFSAGSGYCGFKKDGEHDLGIIASKKRCPTSCVYSTSIKQSAPILLTKKHMENGYAHVIVVNSGRAITFQQDGERVVKDICRYADQHCKVITEDVLFASTGLMGRDLEANIFEDGVRQAAENLAATHEGSLSVAKAMASEGVSPMQVSYAFELGAIQCKIGAVFKANLHASPNMATTLVFLTTDVAITSNMLHKALLHAVNDSLNLMDIDGVPSPNDMACIMANGKAGNWCIDRDDTDYKKFAFALKSVMEQITLTILRNEKNKKQILRCRVFGAKSAQDARYLAKTFVSNHKIKMDAKEAKVNAENFLFHIAQIGAAKKFEHVQIFVSSEFGEIMIFDASIRTPDMPAFMVKVFEADLVQISVKVAKGNYSAMGSTCV